MITFLANSEKKGEDFCPIFFVFFLFAPFQFAGYSRVLVEILFSLGFLLFEKLITPNTDEDVAVACGGLVFQCFRQCSTATSAVHSAHGY